MIRRCAFLYGLVVLVCAGGGCSEGAGESTSRVVPGKRGMAVQPSYQPQEPPRRRSPPHSVPRESRAALTALPAKTEDALESGARLYQINCSHCHGPTGAGDGPVAGDLVELPVNLRSDHVQRKPVGEIHAIITEGRDVMPAFQGELSAEERWLIAYYVASLKAEPGQSTP